jgi:hypothetical protein
MPLFKKEPVQTVPGTPAMLRRDDLLRLLNGEIARAGRHGRFLSVVIASPRLLPDEHLSTREGTAATEAVAGLLRRSDHAGWLDRSTLLLVLPETDPDQAQAAAFRIRSELTRRSTARVINWQAVAHTIQDEATAQQALDAVTSSVTDAA